MDNTTKTKTCDDGHDEITFSYISEIEGCPLCDALEEVEGLREGIKHLKDGIDDLHSEVKNLVDEFEGN